VAARATSSGLTKTSAAAPASPKTAAAPTTDWRQAARAHQWDRAHELLSALPQQQRDKPELRLALGVVSLQAGHHAQAVKLLSDLEQKLPLVREEIRRWHAEAAAMAGPFEQAAEVLLESPKVLDTVAAARAYERGNKLPLALKTINRAVKRASRTRRKQDQAAARWVRARIAEKKGDKALAAADWKWLVRTFPGGHHSRAALAGIARVGGRIALDDKLAAIAKSTDHTNLDETLRSLDELLQSKPSAKAAIQLAKAKALYSARAYDRARDAFDVAAASAAAFAAEGVYYAARAATRASDEPGALRRYREITRRFRNGWTERAAFRAAELLLQLGRYGAAAKGYARYLSSYGKSRSAASARYGRALALLGSGKPKAARKQLAGLRKDARSRRRKASLLELEGVAALQAGDTKAATRIWLRLVEKQPLTWPALAAHARLRSIGHTPLPPLIGEPRAVPLSPLTLSMPRPPALLHSVGLDGAAEKRLRGMEDETAKQYPGRESEALCELYGKLTGASRRHQIGNRAVSLAVLMRAPTATERWAWHCLYPHPYSRLVRGQEDRHQLPAGLIHAVMRQESAFRATAVSRVGARGLMQLMPKTAELASGELKLATTPEQISRPDVNLKLGAFYLGKLLRTFQHNLPLAVAAYNAGPHAVDAWLKGAGGRELDLWVAAIPYAETRHYVERVLGNFARYQWLAGGADNVAPVELKLPSGSKLAADAY